MRDLLEKTTSSFALHQSIDWNASNLPPRTNLISEFSLCLSPGSPERRAQLSRLAFDSSLLVSLSLCRLKWQGLMQLRVESVSKTVRTLFHLIDRRRFLAPLHTHIHTNTHARTSWRDYDEQQLDIRSWRSFAVRNRWTYQSGGISFLVDHDLLLHGGSVWQQCDADWQQLHSSTFARRRETNLRELSSGNLSLRYHRLNVSSDEFHHSVSSHSRAGQRHHDGID